MERAHRLEAERSAPKQNATNATVPTRPPREILKDLNGTV